MTGDARARMSRVMGLELALLEAEVHLARDLVESGIMPPGARRQPTAPELRAAVRFAELDRIVLEAAALIDRRNDRVRDAVLDALATELGDALAGGDPWVALAHLDELRDPTSGRTLPGVREVADEVADTIRGDLVAAARAAGEEARAEARRQGLPDRLLSLDVDVVTETVEAAATAHAQRVTKAHPERLLNAAAEAGQRAATRAGATAYDVVSDALDAAEQASRKAAEDAARQAANVTHGLGRAEAQAHLPNPREVYASELLDSSTCGPCATVDGRTYESLEAALVDYPGAGGYIGCDGGSRCRGALVLVHHTEAAPTLDNPGSGPTGAPVDRTPRGPSGVGRPAHIDADGNLIPKRPPPPDDLPPAPAPDPGVPPLPSAPGAAIDDAGRTAMPVEDLEAPIPSPVNPATVDRDPDLARYADHELEELLTADDVPFDRRLLAADELDHRAAGTRSRVWDEEDLDAATLARYETEREAWEAAGGWAADGYASSVASTGAGRRVDRVRDEWAGQVQMDYLTAEDATRGSMIRRDRVEEYRRKYGTSTAPLMEGPARVAYYYASPELRQHWDSLPGGRKTFAEYALERGVADAKTRKRAAAAARAREEARIIAEESVEKRAERKRARAARNRRTLSAGERLEQERRRRDRIKARERRLQAEAGAEED